MLDVVSTLFAYVNPTILVACLVVGYIVKHWIKDADNAIIPTLVFVLGMIFAVIIALTTNIPITFEIVLGGAISGLASTGLHQVFKSWIEGLDKQ